MKRLISLLLALLLMCGAVANVISVSADETTPVVVKFKDTNLKKAVAKVLGVSSSSNITDEMMLNLKELKAGELEISDITGLEYAKNLETLSLYNNNIKDLSPLSDLENITTFSIANNLVTSLESISKCTKLDYIDFSQNEISDISPLENMTSLRIVMGQSTAVTDISPLKNAKNITDLKFANNNISDISILSDHVKMWDLDLYGNNISDISALSNMKSLAYVDLAHNEITDISPLIGLNSLSSVNLGYNKITDISPLLGLTSLSSAKIQYNDLVIKENSDDMKNIDTLLNNGVSVRYSPMNKYTVTFYVNEKVHASEEVEYGLDLTNIPEVPEVPGSTGRWSVTDFTNITENIDVNAIYDLSKVYVRFYVDGEIYEEIPVNYGAALTELPELPEIYGKNVSWDVAGVDLTNIKSDIRIDAKIETIQYIITFMVDGKPYATRKVNHGGMLTDIPQVPEVTGKTGAWSNAFFHNVTSDMTVEAVYTDIVPVIRFYVEGELYAERTVSYGGTLTDIPEVPQKNGHYASWSIESFENVTHNIEVSSVYLAMVYPDSDKYVVKAKEKFTFTLTTRSEVTNIGLMNENGKFMGKSFCAGNVDAANPDYKIWTITTSIATKGLDRKIGIWLKIDDEFVNSYTYLNIDILSDVALGKDNKPQLVGDNAIVIDKNNVKVNENIIITVKTNSEVTNIKLMNESGKALGKVSQSSVDEGDVRIWTIAVKFGSKGANRRIDVCLCDKSGDYSGVVGSTESITVKK